jgi:hypothetical protein
MSDQLSSLYNELLEGSYDCVDRVILNAYFSMGQSGGGLRVWWHAPYGSDENLDDKSFDAHGGAIQPSPTSLGRSK